MIGKWKRVFRAAVAASAGCGAIFAQQQSKEPRAGYVYPAGAQAGSTVEIVVGGQYLDGPKEVLFSRPGIAATVEGYRKPLPQGRFNELRDYLQEQKNLRAQSQKGEEKNAGGQRPRSNPTAETPKLVAEILKEAGASDDEVANFLSMREEKRDNKRQKNAQLEETVSLRVEVSPEAALGPCSFRLVGASGITNPATFCIGRLPEVVDRPTADKPLADPLEIKLPAVLNGRILPGQTRGYRFDLNRGEKVLVLTQARDLIPYLADAVPGWFQAEVSLSDPGGNPVFPHRFFRQGPDPVVHFIAPQSGRYSLQIRDALYRGREDFVYRISVGDLPYVGGVFPLGGREGEAIALIPQGVSLPFGHPFSVKPSGAGFRPVAELSNGLATGDVEVMLDRLPEIAESEAAGGSDAPIKLPLPAAINGRIDKPGDIDRFSFSCWAGDRLVAEVFARRLNSPLDSWLRLRGPDGKQIAFSDDFEDRGVALLTDQADSRIEFSAPADGNYTLEIGDSRNSGGEDFAYRLRVAAPKPDFEVRVSPSGINGRAGTHVPITLHALRKDGFGGAIDVRLKDPPEGFALGGGRIPPGADSVRATLSLPRSAPGSPVRLEFESVASIGERKIARSVTPADDMLQAFIYRHLVPADGFYASVIGNKNGKEAAPPIAVSGGLALHSGESAKIIVSRAGKPPFNISETRLQIDDPPPGITISEVIPVEGGAAVTFTCGPEAKPGTCGNLFVEAFGERKEGKAGEKPSVKSWPMGFFPAIPFEIGER